MSFLFSPIGKFLGIAVMLIVLVAGFKLWLYNHDKATLAGYVALSEKTAAEAKAAEAKRQADINAQSAEEYRKKLVIVQAQNAKDDVEQEARIKDYEAKLDAANRRCNLNDDDLRVILHNGAGKADPVGKRKGPN